MPTVYIPTPMRRFSLNKTAVVVDPGPIADVLAQLDAMCPGIRAQIYDDRGNIKKYVNVFVNDRDIRVLNGDATIAEANDEVYIVPALAGG